MLIENERQYRITLTQAEKFEHTLTALRDTPDTRPNIDPILREAELEALADQAHELREHLAEFDALRSGDVTTIRAESFDDLPNALIQARIARSLTQRDLARRLGVNEQQIQRHEATRYASASLARVGEVIRALGVEVREEISIPRVDVPISTPV